MQIPHKYNPRSYQIPLLSAIDKGMKRAFVFIHRRGGKDKTCVNLVMKRAVQEKGIHYYFLPTATQARKIIWDNQEMMQHFPQELCEFNSTEMKVKLKTNGSIIQFIGTDKFDCYSEDTEILTDKGWKLFRDISDDAVVATRTEHGIFEYNKINKKMEYDFEGDMYSLKNNALDLLVTENHRFFVKSRKGVNKFKAISDDTIIHDKIPSTCLWLGEGARYFEQEGIKIETELFCKFMALWLSDGSKRVNTKKGTYEIIITKKKPEGRRIVENVLNEMGVNWSYRGGNYIFANKEFCVYLSQFGLCDKKFIPQFIKDLATMYLEVFIDYYVNYGDGHKTKTGVQIVYSTSKQLVDDFQEIVIKAGLSGNIAIKPNRGGVINGRKILSKRILYQVSIRRSKYKYFASTKKDYRTKQSYKGKVYCVNVKNNVVKVRRNGKECWSGNSIRGTNPITCIFSEYAFQDPRVWDIVRPILNENGGIAVFQTTPNGDNHASELFEMAEKNADWFTDKLDITQTKRDALGEKGGPVITPEDIEEERRMGMPEEMVRQEYFCDAGLGKVGSFWGEQLAISDKQGNITKLPRIPSARVDIYSDLGVSDSTSLWFVQKIDKSYHFINSEDDNNKGIAYYMDLVDNWLLENGLQLGVFNVPHDGKKRDMTSGVSVYDMLVDRYGVAHVRRIPVSGKALQIDTARALIPYCAFDKEKCVYGLKALKNYHRKYNEVKKVFQDNPDHDWSSHLADAFQNFAMANKEVLIPKEAKEGAETIDYSDIQANPFVSF